MQENKRLEGARFVLFDCNHKEIMCIKTDCNGEALIENLPYGHYTLIETEAPCGYKKYDKEIEIIISDNCPDKCVEVVNCQLLGSLKIIKTGI